jgi:hypothetical protein
MTRRALLSLLALAAVDPERLIWTPGKRLISIPATLLSHPTRWYGLMSAYFTRDNAPPWVASPVQPVPSTIVITSTLGPRVRGDTEKLRLPIEQPYDFRVNSIGCWDSQRGGTLLDIIHLPGPLIPYPPETKYVEFSRYELRAAGYDPIKKRQIHLISKSPRP